MSRCFYTTWGPIAGPCGHRHYCVGAARKCVDAHAAFRRKHRMTPSDREVRVILDERGHIHFNHTKGPGAPL